ncbi:MAG: phosphotransferase [Dehalococcoidia bacterium]
MSALATKPPLPLPKAASELTAEWLNLALAEEISAPVTAFSLETIAQGVGFLGELARVTLDYAAPGAGPRTLIAKLPTGNDRNRMIAVYFQLYQREIGFYQEMAEHSVVRVPHCYFAQFDAAEGRFALLLEDLAPLRVGDQVESCTIELARLALRELARHQARWWESPELDGFAWLPSVDCDANRGLAPMYAGALPLFLEQTAGRLSEPVRDTACRLEHLILPALTAYTDRPATVVHGDYRLDNLFFSDAGDELAVIDWQIMSRGPGVFDAAYFLGGSLEPEVRRLSERDLLREYHETLVANGVRDYDFATMWEDYRRSMAFMLYIPVVGVGEVMDLTNERGIALFNAMTDRYCTAVEDLEAWETLPSV